MRILITGGTGFIGKILVSYLLQQQSIRLRLAVRQIPNYITSCEIAHIDNINSHTDWEQALENVDTVIHLAAYAHVVHPRSVDLDSLHACNVKGTCRLIQECLNSDVRHIIFMSSIGAITSLSSTALTETSLCTPDTFYGQSKLKAEQSIITMTEKHDLTWTILRPPLVYGSGNPGNMERLIKLINRGLPLPFGLVNNRRSLLYVGNLVDAIATCLTHPNAKNQTFLVSDGQDLSTPELIRKIAYHLERPCHLLPVPPSLLKLAGHLGDTIEQFTKRPLPLSHSTIDRLLGSLIVDSSHIRNTLNWEPPYTLDEGLSKTLP